MIDELEQLVFRNSEIRDGELIWNVPAKRSELSTLEYQSIEEAETPKKTSEDNRFLAVIELVFSKSKIRASDVISKAFRRFSSNFDSILNDCYRKLVTRHSGQPDSKGCVLIENNLFKNCI